MRILFVAEKPSIAKEIAKALGGGSEQKRVGKSKFNPVFDLTYNFSNEWGSSAVTVTSVSGHVKEATFPPPYNEFSHDPKSLFDAPVIFEVPQGSKQVAENLKREARGTDILYIWTDCDREGELIGYSVSEIVKQVNRSVQVKRGLFSNVEASHIRQAASRPKEIDMNAVKAAKARSELDLRTGYAMTRLQSGRTKATLNIQDKQGALSYGSCQFPTMGFVIDRYIRVRDFKPEPFWKIVLNIKGEDGKKCVLNWDRNRLFDHASAFVLYERMLDKGDDALVTNVSTKPVKQYKPLPLTTVTLQKLGTKFLKMSGKSIMDHAEKLYQKGFISYPRTETDQFDSEIDLPKIVQKLRSNHVVGDYATKLLDEGGFRDPRRGKNNDKAHPPIHPVQSIGPNVDITRDQQRVYEFVTRSFLASCSDDAKGEQTTANVDYGEEKFHTSGVVVKEKNYLEVYVYGSWNSTSIPDFSVGQKLSIMSCLLSKSETTAPSYLTESELVGLMNANGIGTDATMADHIEKIKQNEYIVDSKKGKKDAVLIPTALGMALYVAYSGINLPRSVTRPHLRQQTEKYLHDVATGDAELAQVMAELVSEHRKIFETTHANLGQFLRLAKEEFEKF